MRRLFEQDIELDARKLALLANHSFLNLFNVLERHLALISQEIPSAELHRYSRFCLEILADLSQLDIRERIPDIQRNYSSLNLYLNRLKNEFPGSRKRLDQLLEITSVGHHQLMELKEERHIWTTHSAEHMESFLKIFLESQARVSDRRIGFIFAKETDSPEAYAIDFQIKSRSGTLTAPNIINDVIRDLVCNSRKYSDPGSSIRVVLEAREDGTLFLSASDEGMGIPPDEIDEVVKFGYRATNALDRRTMGWGIGLTKAYHLCRQCKGRFVIESEIGKGTTIEMTLSPPS
ncbi:MAG: ATP-binding protein [Opitutales bacterium]|jgi:signal transduction histidine kinase